MKTDKTPVVAPDAQESTKQDALPNDTQNPDALPQQEPRWMSKGFRRRIIALAVILGILLALFIFRLVQFQLVDGARYLSEATGSLAG